MTFEQNEILAHIPVGTKFTVNGNLARRNSNITYLLVKHPAAGELRFTDEDIIEHGIPAETEVIAPAAPVIPAGPTDEEIEADRVAALAQAESDKLAAAAKKIADDKAAAALRAQAEADKKDAADKQAAAEKAAADAKDAAELANAEEKLAEEAEEEAAQDEQPIAPPVAVPPVQNQKSNKSNK